MGTVMGLLSGIRILSVEQYGAGPFGSQALADLGAEVVKIENPKDGGDVSRSLGPYFEEDLPDTADSLFFAAVNRNKRSVALDLSRDDGRRVFHRLVADADAVACNLRGDVPDRLGLTYETLGAIKQDIVCCHLTAYGRTGSRANWPGYDYLIQAEAGYFDLNGEPDSPPSRFGLSIVDFMTGYTMGLGLVAGILNARSTGTGRDIDVSLYDVGVANLSYLATWALNTGYQPTRQPRSAHPSLTPCQLYRTADGWLYVMANKEKFWPILCDRIGRPALAADPRFASFADRLKHRTELTDLLDDALSVESTEAWIARLSGAVPCAPVNTVTAALASPFLEESGMAQTLGPGPWQAYRTMGNPIRTSEPDNHRPPPVLGQDTDTLLAEAGLTPDEISQLRTSGAIG